MPMLTKDGKRRLPQANGVALRDSDGKVAAVAWLGADVTEHRAPREQYLQAQKLESVGRLAGGIAHDFNNLLTVINGYSDIIVRDLRADDPLKEHVQEICHARARAAALTQQLLVFSRKQVAQPQLLDLNALITQSKDMLCRLLGEHVRLETALAPEIGSDPGGQRPDSPSTDEPCWVNARDAMPDGGELRIETSHVDVGGNAGNDPRQTPGSYLLLIVTDNGSGIDEETQHHIFEPFFTTKPVGKGTGLGLATVYGIVTQIQGWIEIASELGHGTAFRIYLPQVRAATGKAVPRVAQDGVVRGFETVLVVEDQASVRKFVSDVLSPSGYKVLSATDGTAAMATAERHPGRIHLVLTDVVMPGMNGPDLVEKLRQGRPEIPGNVHVRLCRRSDRGSRLRYTRGQCTSPNPSLQNRS
jgi:signal transduction histidine kinase